MHTAVLEGGVSPAAEGGVDVGGEQTGERAGPPGPGGVQTDPPTGAQRPQLTDQPVSDLISQQYFH